MKIFLVAVTAVCVAAVASSVYVAWLNIVEERQAKKVQPLLGVVYQNQKR